ncbi:DUF4040 domain-containing protein [Tissierella sp. Yu-01]|uniref:DUF4040 domain-containing protein n=1 Tax=Tissierella sp. Yu-01 TaxID=3035694 RepID=UPI00240DC70C|nr:DUF4040 domain-containing protein [Tissierella sp. Yu-01]WFA08471.1 DUF4040 domain-containing protein [Tissierella sp. Yu-01]
MLIYFEALLLILLILTAIAVSSTKKTLNAIIIFTVFSLTMSILWIIIKAPDLGITEAAVGAGVTSLLFYVALRNMGEIKLFDKERKSKKKDKKNSFVYNLFSVIFTIAIIYTLLYTVSFLPQQGSSHVPALNEVFTRYIKSGVEETGAINIVAAVILDYRAFDTFGEATMLFTATIAVVSLLRKEKDEDMIYEEDYKR